MAATDSVASFIRGSFRSVWALELLLHLKQSGDRAWSADELVQALRGSAVIVSQSLDSLMRAGLVSIDEKECAYYQPASAGLEQLMAAAQELYARKPETVRRIIVSAAHPGLMNFADAFRLWKN